MVHGSTNIKFLKTLSERNHSIYMQEVISIESYTQLNMGLANPVT